jgi:hypothetical protein
MRLIWFKRKRYGWGWVPVTWQGWTIIIAFIALMLGNALRLDSTHYSTHRILAEFIPETIVLVAILFFLCYRFGEQPRWQWGNKTNNI